MYGSDPAEPGRSAGSGGRHHPPLDSTSTMIFGAIEDTEYESGGGGSEASRLAEGLPPGSALLIVRRGPNAGSRFLLDAPVTTAGRHPDSDIFLDDVTVSRRHAEFLREGETFAVRDVGSLNGSYVNRERVESVMLTSGDEVQIGKFRLTFITAPRGYAAHPEGMR
ncbi:MAG: FHA domain-containing protein [Corynebacteriales bacterium]|nr:FHA domain-containing protein [Mycobacteriales bacterium]